MKSIKLITGEVLKEFGGRKKPNILSLVIDVNEGKAYGVPKDWEHDTFVSIFLGIKKEDLQENPQIAARIIPVNIEIINGTITGVITGVSGLELGYKVKHRYNDLKKAHELAWFIISQSQTAGHLKVEIRPDRNRIIRI